MKILFLSASAFFLISCMGGITGRGDGDDVSDMADRADPAEDSADTVPDREVIDSPGDPSADPVDVDADIPDQDIPDTTDPVEEVECNDDGDCRDGNPCNGEETCNTFVHLCNAGEPPGDGYVCGSEPREICLEGACLESICGDGFVDTGGGESCEPPGEGDCNEDCAYACESSEDCPDDGNVCNGEEYCDFDEHTCGHRNPAGDGTVCGTYPRSICIDATCQESLCGDGYVDEGQSPPEECEDGNIIEGDGCDNDCRFSCHGDEECDDGHDCTEDRCFYWSTHTCVSTVLADTTLCRPSEGVCDIEEYCDGESADCPEDEFVSDTELCREAAHDCDVSEHCTGLDPHCPDDAMAMEGTECDDANPCTDPDTCDGEGSCYGEPVAGCCDVAALASGGYHNCVIMDDTAGVKCWGYNGHGQVGDGTTVQRLLPVDVSGLSSGVAAVDCGFLNTCVLLDTGSMMCWGNNTWGQIGDGTTYRRLEPVAVNRIWNVEQFSTGGGHNCALRTDGVVRCWGSNTYGQLGDGTTTERHEPVTVSSGLEDGVVRIICGSSHTCALMSTGGVKCWGLNEDGEVGDGTTTNRTRPVDVDGLSSGVAAISLGARHTCALMDTGTVKCWGHGTYGQLGNGSTWYRTSPVDVTGLLDVIFLGVGNWHSCAIIDGGTLKCWGSNSEGQIGDGTLDNRTTPVSVTGLTHTPLFVTGGQFHTCAIMDYGGVKCWGRGDNGVLGNGTDVDSVTPVDVLLSCP